MSYDISNQVHARRAAQDFKSAERTQLDLADRERLEFLRALDAAAIHVTDWEAQFIKGFVDEPKPFSPRQRDVVDKLRAEYGHRLPGQTPASVRALDLPSELGKCDYLVSGDDRRQRRCGEPAVVTVRQCLQLCAAHEQQRQEGIARLRQIKARQLGS